MTHSNHSADDSLAAAAPAPVAVFPFLPAITEGENGALLGLMCLSLQGG